MLSGELRCSWCSADRRCSNYIWMINHLIAYPSTSYIRDLTVMYHKWVFIKRYTYNSIFVQWGMLPWWPLQGIPSWSYIYKSTHPNLFEDRTPINSKYGCPIVKWVAETWLHNNNGCQATCPISYWHFSSTHWGRDTRAAIFQMAFSNALSWMKIYKFTSRFHLSLFPRV